MEVSGKREVGRPRKTWKDIAKRDFELIGVEESVALDRGRCRKIIEHHKSDPCLKGKYGLKR